MYQLKDLKMVINYIAYGGIKLYIYFSRDDKMNVNIKIKEVKKIIFAR